MAEVLPLKWRRIRAGRHRADAGRFGVFEALRADGEVGGPWWVLERIEGGTSAVLDVAGEIIDPPGAVRHPCGVFGTLGTAKGWAVRAAVTLVRSDPATLAEWAAAAFRGGKHGDAGYLSRLLLEGGVDAFWEYLPFDSQGHHDHQALRAYGTVLDAAQGALWAWQAGVRALARDCLADPSLLGVLADAAQDAGLPALEWAARACMAFPGGR